MAYKRKKPPKKRSATARALAQRLYRQRVIRDKRRRANVEEAKARMLDQLEWGAW